MRGGPRSLSASHSPHRSLFGTTLMVFKAERPNIIESSIIFLLTTFLRSAHGNSEVGKNLA